MFNKGRLTPLHKAIIEENLELVAQLKDSNWQDQPDNHGFKPLELAQLLGRRECQTLLGNVSSPFLKVQLKDQSSPIHLDLIDFEKIFKIIYRPFLIFPSYQALEEIIHNCSYLFRFESLMGSDQWEVSFQAKLSMGVIAKTYIRWIDSIVGYGLYADADLPHKSFVGEYTGVVRQLSKNHPNPNSYCFHYPTRFWSFKYYIIDSLEEGNISRFINHSSRPNLQPLWLLNRGVLHLIFMTNQMIPKGTELTFDYGADYWIHRKMVSY